MADPVLDDFDAAFAEITAEAEKQVQTPALALAPESPAPEPAPAPETPAPEPAPVTIPVTTPVPAPVSAPVSASVPAVTPVPVPVPVPVAPAPVSAPAPVPESPKETPEQKAAREQFEESIKSYEPTAEEKAALDKSRRDFPDEWVGIDAHLKMMDRTVNQRVYQAVQMVLQHINKTVTPVMDGYTADAAERHFTALRSAHPDYDAVITKIPEWINTQPAYLRPAMKAAYDDGTTQDVLALVGDYKKAVGTVAPAPVPVPVPKKPDESDSLAPVSSKRVASAPKGRADPNDYDGAFAEAAVVYEK